MITTHRLRPLLFLSAFSVVAVQVAAQQFDPAALKEMHWRNIGPFRGGRTKSAAGVPSQPNVFYMGVTNGGVWKTTDFGATWRPIFDDQPTGSIGAVAVAPSDPNIIYVGSGEGLQRPDLSTGDGMYKSTDAGRTWTHLGLRDGQQIPQIAIDPKDPNRLFVAVLGHPYGPNEERGIYRSLDGGNTFQRVLGKDENTGGIEVIFDPENAQVVYAALWESRQGPWENAAWSGPGSGLFKSIDGGNTWRQLTNGLPTAPNGVGRIGLGIAPSNGKRIFAAVEVGGLYRSDDAGESWTKITDDNRVVSRGSDMAEVRVDPRNPDVVYTASIVSWQSTDGGKTWRALRGAPGGDDYQRFWINPNNPDIMLLVSDQGASVTVNGGATWSSWYNQSTAQFYHVTADDAFPYRLCGGQQESGSACVASRGNDGRITFREWHPVGIEEYGYAAPDPLDPDIVYGGKVSRYDRRTGQVQSVSPAGRGGGGFRAVRTAPVVFSMVDKHLMFFAQNVVWKTVNGGSSWTQISPDLTRKTWGIPANVGIYKVAAAAQQVQRGVIYTIAPSYSDINTIWAGTDDGLIQVTRDGGVTWHDVTPAGVTAWAKVSLMDAGRFDAATAYAAVNTIRLDDLRPHIYRTHDGGKTWQEIVNGIPAGETVNVVREDPRRRGMLVAGTERTVYVSLDDGDHWQSMRLNLPVTSVRDLVIKDDDIAIGTHGRGFWILDDIAALRQWTATTAATGALLFKPADAWRVRWNTNTDTPLPPDEPAGENPPEGAIIDYWLKSSASGVVTLEIADSAGRVVRRYTSADQPLPIGDIGNIPGYWMRPTQILSASAGFHRFVWDEHFGAPVGNGPANYPMSATPFNTAPSPGGPWVHPGLYHATLAVDGQRYVQAFHVKMDPRVKTPAAALRQQYAISVAMFDGVAAVRDVQEQIRVLRADIATRCPRAPGATRAALDTLDRELAALAGPATGGGGGGGGGASSSPCGGGADAAPPAVAARRGRGRGGAAPANTPPSFGSVSAQMSSALAIIQGSDLTPTITAIKAATDAQAQLAVLTLRWKTLGAQAKKALPE